MESHKPDGVRNAIKKGYSLLNQLLTQTMMNGQINPVSAIFLLKNNYEYKDQSEVIVTPNSAFQDTDPASAREKLLDALPDEE